MLPASGNKTICKSQNGESGVNDINAGNQGGNHRIRVEMMNKNVERDNNKRKCALLQKYTLWFQKK